MHSPPHTPSLITLSRGGALSHLHFVAQTHFLQHLFPREREEKKCGMLMKNKVNNIINCPAP